MSSENNAHNDSADSSQLGGPTDLDLASLATETFNTKTSNEENIDSNFLIEAFHHMKEGKIVVPEPKQQRSTKEQGIWRGL